jgi:DNA-binding transcriptional LysR family regulator
MGCTFLPEYIALYPELPMRVVSDPDVIREVGLATVAGRLFSPAVDAFVRMVRTHDWNS